jgi:hypothetical protein
MLPRMFVPARHQVHLEAQGSQEWGPLDRSSA